MKNKNMMIFVVLFTVAFALLVSLKFFDRNKKIQLNSEFSLEENQVVKVANKDYTSIKLTSIVDKCTEGSCVSNKSLEYKVLINGKEYIIADIPQTIGIYKDGFLKVIDGDEDRLVLSVVEK